MALQQSASWHVNLQTRKHTDVTTISWSLECMYVCVCACVLSVWWLCSKVHRRICAAYCMHKHALTQDLEPVCVVNPSARVRVSRVREILYAQVYSWFKAFLAPNHVHTHTHIHTHTHTYTEIQTHTKAQTDTHTYMHEPTNKHKQKHKNMRTQKQANE